MLNNKKILEQMLEIGGIATLNNFYSPEAKTYLGSLYNIRKKFKLFLENELMIDSDDRKNKISCK